MERPLINALGTVAWSDPLRVIPWMRFQVLSPEIRFLHFIKRVDLPFHQESLLYVLSPINTTSLEARPNFRLISSRNCAAAPICEFAVDFHSQSGSTEQAALS